MKKIKTKSRVALKVSAIIKFLQDTEYCPVEGPESAREMLIKMAPCILGTGAAADQRAETQSKALSDLEEVLRGALKLWYDKVKHCEDEVALAEEKKHEAMTAQESAASMIESQTGKITDATEEVEAATTAAKEAKALFKKSKGVDVSEADVEAAKAKVATLTAALKEAKAAKKTIVAAEKAAEKDIAKTSKVVANAQGHLAVEQVGLEKVQAVFAKFKALRDRKAKSPMKRKKAEPDDEDGEDGAKIVGSPSFLDRVASRIMGVSPKPEPKEDEE